MTTVAAATVIPLLLTAVAAAVEAKTILND